MLGSWLVISAIPLFFPIRLIREMDCWSTLCVEYTNEVIVSAPISRIDRTAKFAVPYNNAISEEKERSIIVANIQNFSTLFLWKLSIAYPNSGSREIPTIRINIPIIPRYTLLK
ncbi:MAG: hypothetical protein AMDU4_FER2C00321G0002 [Ferroplasma sp. Type II]|nr:MAG: hypothetical protein AMDU4_FER2C00321G0002 [Ferroplasma sp. Type II]